MSSATTKTFVNPRTMLATTASGVPPVRTTRVSFEARATLLDASAEDKAAM
jgi:hypothetical protein